MIARLKPEMPAISHDLHFTMRYGDVFLLKYKESEKQVYARISVQLYCYLLRNAQLLSCYYEIQLWKVRHARCKISEYFGATLALASPRFSVVPAWVHCVLVKCIGGKAQGWQSTMCICMICPWNSSQGWPEPLGTPRSELCNSGNAPFYKLWCSCTTKEIGTTTAWTCAKYNG